MPSKQSETLADDLLRSVRKTGDFSSTIRPVFIKCLDAALLAQRQACAEAFCKPCKFGAEVGHCVESERDPCNQYKAILNAEVQG